MRELIIINFTLRGLAYTAEMQLRGLGYLLITNIHKLQKVSDLRMLMLPLEIRSMLCTVLSVLTRYGYISIWIIVITIQAPLTSLLTTQLTSMRFVCTHAQFVLQCLCTLKNQGT